MILLPIITDEPYKINRKRILLRFSASYLPNPCHSDRTGLYCTHHLTKGCWRMSMFVLIAWVAAVMLMFWLQKVRQSRKLTQQPVHFQNGQTEYLFFQIFIQTRLFFVPQTGERQPFVIAMRKNMKSAYVCMWRRTARE